MNFGKRAIADVNWASFRVLRGTGDDLAKALIRFLQSENSSTSEAAWKDLENVVFAQDTIYEAAEPTVMVLLAALADERAVHARGWIIELLFFLLNGGSLEDPGLAARCRAQAGRGVWLLAREARLSEGAARDAVVNVIRIIDPDVAEKIARWLI